MIISRNHTVIYLDYTYIEFYNYKYSYMVILIITLLGYYYITYYYMISLLTT